MACGYQGCSNPGVHSCSECGRLRCGKHASVSQSFGSGSISVNCQSCHDARVVKAEASARQLYQEDRETRRWWLKGLLYWEFLCGLVIAVGAVGYMVLDQGTAAQDAMAWGFGLAATPLVIAAAIGIIVGLFVLFE
jgi:hypothetical protein